MGDVELLSSHKSKRSEDILTDVRYALKCLGGAAHVNLISSTVEAKLRAEKGDAFQNIAADVEAILYAHDLDNKALAKIALFKRPFGTNSKRWALHQPVQPVVSVPRTYKVRD